MHNLSFFENKMIEILRSVGGKSSVREILSNLNSYDNESCDKYQLMGWLILMRKKQLIMLRGVTVSLNRHYKESNSQMYKY